MSKQKIAITLEAETLERVRTEVRLRRSPSVSAYISTAVAAQLEADAMRRLVEELRREHGKPSREARAWARAVLRKEPR
jgi:hypothetical protein